MDDRIYVTITIAEHQRLLNEIERYKKSLEKIERYTHFDINGLEFIRDETMFALDKL